MSVRRAALVVLVAAAGSLAAACGGGGTGGDGGDGAARGAVPIPRARPRLVVTATAGHPGVLAMGGPVDAELGARRRAVVTALGPRSRAPVGARSAQAVITVRVAARRGRVRLAALDLSSRDETGRAIALRPEGAAAVSAAPGHTAALRVAGRFPSGAAQLTWRDAGRVMAVWTFNIELD